MSEDKEIQSIITNCPKCNKKIETTVEIIDGHCDFVCNYCNTKLRIEQRIKKDGEIAKSGIFFSEIFEEITSILKKSKYYYETLFFNYRTKIFRNASLNRYSFNSLDEAINNKKSMIAEMSKNGVLFIKRSYYDKDIIYLDNEGKPIDENTEFANKISEFFYSKYKKNI